MSVDPQKLAAALMGAPGPGQMLPTETHVADAGYTLNPLNGQIQQWPSQNAARDAALRDMKLIHVTRDNIDNIPNMPNEMYAKLKAVVR